MNDCALRFLGESPGIAPWTATQRPQDESPGRYVGMRTIRQHPGSLKIRGTAGCCIRSKSSRFTIHSFREGNTRSQFVFFSQLAENAGYRLDAEQFKVGAVLRDEFVAARFYVQATTRIDRLTSVLDKALTKIGPDSLGQPVARERTLSERAQMPRGVDAVRLAQVESAAPATEAVKQHPGASRSSSLTGKTPTQDRSRGRGD